MKKGILLFSLGMLLLSGCSRVQTEQEILSDANKTALTVTTTIDPTINLESTDWENENPITINLNNPQAITGVVVEEGRITIGLAGTYVLSGSYEGQIKVALNTDEDVRLVLNGVSIHSEQDAAIFVESVKDCMITLASGTTNTVFDGTSYTSETEATAAIYSKDDLKINGSGRLIVSANYNNAIQSKDDLFILGGHLEITALEKGLVGKDSVRIAEGSITITSGKDAIQSTNTEDSSKGYILITGGELKLITDQDGIQAETQCLITGGTISIVSGGGSGSVTQQNGWQHPAGFMTTQSNEEEISAKGIKASIDLTIQGGTITIDSADDALHSNNSLTINDGVLTLSSGDDGVHSDTALQINGGSIEITQSYEGLESASIIINGGEIVIAASDDGINAAGGADASGQSSPGGFRQDNFNGGDDSCITISGGNILINANGDGIDSNGDIVMSGGTLLVFGPSDQANGTLDFAKEFTLSGGTLIAVGSSGMMQTPSATSTQYSISTTSAQGSANNSILIKDEEGTTLWSGFAQKSFNAVLYSDANLEKGKTYTIWINDQEIESIEVNSLVSGSIQGGFTQGEGRGQGPMGKQIPNEDRNQEEMQGFPRNENQEQPLQRNQP